MCGITGYINLSSTINKKHLFKMLALIKHRGPDDTGTFFDKYVALGVQRLSIIDLKGGNQPISNEDDSIWVVFNGEIYNYVELRKSLIKKHNFKTKSDTEVLIHLYEEYGDEFPKFLNGMFSFAIYDKKKNKLILGRDFIGVKPLYFYQKEGKLIFGSELKTILAFPNIRRAINLQSLELYKLFGYVPQPKSIFKGIEKLGPGEILVFSKSGTEIKRYWEINTSRPNNVVSLNKLLQKSIKIQSRSDVPIGVFLSGGIDSSLVAYYLSKTLNRSFKTFSIAFSEKSFDEKKYFNQVASILKTDHHFENFGVRDLIELFPKITQKLDEPLADPSLFPTYKLSELASKHVKVVLSGDGGDELFAGYPTYSSHIIANLFNRTPSYLLNHLVALIQKIPVSHNNYPVTEKLAIFFSGLDLDLINRHLLWMSLDKSRSLIPSFNKNKWVELLSKQINNLDYNWKIKVQLLDFFTYLTDDLLVKVDRASMYNSLEVRVPFLDPDIVNFAFSKDKKHFNLFESKIMLRKLLKDKLPKTIVERNKKGFGIPISAWIQKPIRDLVEGYLRNSQLYDYFDKKTVYKDFNMHIEKRANFGRKIWMLVIFSAWLKKWK